MSDIIIHGARDGVNPHQKSEAHHRFFTARYEWRLFENVGHNLRKKLRRQTSAVQRFHQLSNGTADEEWTTFKRRS
jgi:hypothetical protein